MARPCIELICCSLRQNTFQKGPFLRKKWNSTRSCARRKTQTVGFTHTEPLQASRRSLKSPTNIQDIRSRHAYYKRTSNSQTGIKTPCSNAPTILQPFHKIPFVRPSTPSHNVARHRLHDTCNALARLTTASTRAKAWRSTTHLLHNDRRSPLPPTILCPTTAHRRK